MLQKKLNIAHMNALGKSITVSYCGFLVHPTQRWLGASPDGVVVDATFETEY